MVFELEKMSFSDQKMQDILDAVDKEWSLKSSKTIDNFKMKERRLIEVEKIEDGTIVYSGIVDIGKESKQVIKLQTFERV